MTCRSKVGKRYGQSGGGSMQCGFVDDLKTYLFGLFDTLKPSTSTGQQVPVVLEMVLQTRFTL